MPSKNVIKENVPSSYYHVYSRGSNKQKIFIEDIDYKYFLGLLGRYLSDDEVVSKSGEIYPNFNGKIKLLAYCLMSNHYHILVYQSDTSDLERFMRSLATSYSRYYNLKYKRTGPVFESRYKASRIDNDGYLHHISRYIHLNPRLWSGYRYSSLKYYLYGNEPSWLDTSGVLELFSSREDYGKFISEYQDEEVSENLIDYLVDK